ncbi:hypothetical protein Tco_0977655 [Tanacetum coccineum]|uniref:Uncharacterized protein n=1 Tax=Tanacetum coccineum TaxID=301880 RepID=A0ABQ5EKP5_9ASTR
MDKTQVMENASLLTHKTLISIKKEDRLDKHGVPPTSFDASACLGSDACPSPKFIGLWGSFGDREKPRCIKEFSLGFDPSEVHFSSFQLNFPVYHPQFEYQKICMLDGASRLCALARSVDDMPSRTIQLSMEYTRWAVL